MTMRALSVPILACAAALPFAPGGAPAAPAPAPRADAATIVRHDLRSGTTTREPAPRRHHLRLRRRAGSGDRPRTPDERLAEVVFGSDDRSRVEDTTVWPWSAICRVEMEFPSGFDGVGSAVLVGPRHALTAGHVIHDAREGGWATRVVVTPGRNGQSEPWGSFEASDLVSVAGWTDDEDTGWDFAIIELPTAIGQATGWMGYSWTDSDLALVGEAVTIAGYPADREGGTRPWQSTGTLDFVTATTLHYNGTLDTAGGQSGSGIHRMEDLDPVVIGVHTNGGLTHNHGTRITETLFDLIEEVRGAGGGSHAEPEPDPDPTGEDYFGDGVFRWRKTNRLRIGHGQYVRYRFVVGVGTESPVEDPVRLRFKVRPKRAFAVVYPPGGGAFRLDPGPAVDHLDPVPGTWEVHVYAFPRGDRGRTKLKVVPKRR